MKRYRATAVAHPMQGLVKYHGLRDWRLRIPYHDSVSANIAALWTKTTVEFGDFKEDRLTIGGAGVAGPALKRCTSVLNQIRSMAGIQLKAKVSSVNSVGLGAAKGLGYSSSGGAALAAAAFKAARLDERFGWDLQLISRVARRLAGSACRSVVGGYARWHAGFSDETSYAERIADPDALNMAMVVVPLGLDVTTEEAHRGVETSAFFGARLRSASRRVKEMERAIGKRDAERVGELAELDSLELHALTMTSKDRLMLYKPESITVINAVKKMRGEGIPAYFSMQTGPSVFINTRPERVNEVLRRLKGLGLKTIVSRVGGEARLTKD